MPHAAALPLPCRVIVTVDGSVELTLDATEAGTARLDVRTYSMVESSV